jgi:alanyl-tRNA synthetase
MQNNFTKNLAEIIIQIYPDYPQLKQNQDFVLQEIEKEENRFRQSLQSGLNFFNKIAKGKEISCEDAFLLYQSYGFPIEMTLELAKEKGMKVDTEGFTKKCEIHQELSRTASSGQFKSGLADHSEETTKLHTAAHMLLAALRQVLGKDIHQRGSNITAERLRFDFSFDRKLTEEEIKKVENLVNEQIKKKIPVIRQEFSLEQAKKSGAEGIFDDKYKNLEKVFVYTIANFSREICSGPHVKNTCELKKFKITKEEASSAGVRRIKAVLAG